MARTLFKTDQIMYNDKNTAEARSTATGVTMKKILLVTSVYTGAGHKSISDSLLEQFAKLPDVQVQVIDGF